MGSGKRTYYMREKDNGLKTRRADGIVVCMRAAGVKTVTAMVLCACMALLFAAPAYAQPAPIQMPEELQGADAPVAAVVAEKVECESDGNTLRGIAMRPGGDGKVAVVILLHGFLADRDEHYGIYEELARELAARGIASLRFDLGGTGKSDGSLLDMSVRTEQADAAAILDYAKKLPYADTGRMGVVGMSLGGVAAALLAAERPGELRSMCLWSPAARMVEELQSAPVISGVGSKFVADMQGLDFFGEAAGYGGDVLLAYGSGDALMGDGYAQRVAALYPGAEVCVIENKGHLFEDGARARILAVTADHLCDTLMG